MKQVQIIPKAQLDLVALASGRRKEIEQARAGQGAFLVASSGKRGRARTETWKHRKHPGRVKLVQGMGGVMLAQIIPKADADEGSEVFGAFMSWLDRNCGEEILAINVQYRDE